VDVRESRAECQLIAKLQIAEARLQAADIRRASIGGVRSPISPVRFRETRLKSVRPIVVRDPGLPRLLIIAPMFPSFFLPYFVFTAPIPVSHRSLSISVDRQPSRIVLTADRLCGFPALSRVVPSPSLRTLFREDHIGP